MDGVVAGARDAGDGENRLAGNARGGDPLEADLADDLIAAEPGRHVTDVARKTCAKFVQKRRAEGVAVRENRIAVVPLLVICSNGRQLAALPDDRLRGDS